MDLLRSVIVHCPYCGEPLDLDIDCSVPSQSYVEDCQVCCRPIFMVAEVDEEGEPSVAVRQEND